MDYKNQLKLYGLLGHTGVAAVVASIGLAIGSSVTGDPNLALAGYVAGMSGVEAYNSARVGKELTHLNMQASGLEDKLEEH